MCNFMLTKQNHYHKKQTTYYIEVVVIGAFVK